jgi:putative endonuclease
MDWYYVYVLKSELDQSWYIGYTKDLDSRLQQHNSGKCETTSRKMPWIRMYFEASLSKSDAIAREKYLKSGMGRRYLKNRLKIQLEHF